MSVRAHSVCRAKGQCRHPKAKVWADPDDCAGISMRVRSYRVMAPYGNTSAIRRLRRCCLFSTGLCLCFLCALLLQVLDVGLERGELLLKVFCTVLQPRGGGGGARQVTQRNSEYISHP